MTYLRVFDIDGGAFSVMQADEGALEAAMQRLFDGKDSLVTVRLLDGDECVFRASRIAGWLVSTPEGRRRGMEIERDLDAQTQANRMELGIWDASD